MIAVKTRMAFFFAVVLGIAGLCVLAVFHEPTEERVKHRRTTFDRTVAEGMRLWNPKTGVDCFRFDACRIEKLRMGAFHLGWFNVLCLDGLVLNLPLPAEEERGGKREERGGKSGGRGAAEVFARMLPQTLIEKAGVSGGNFAGIEIKGLQVNKVENRREVPVFAADEAKNQGRTLKLKNCRVFNEGRTNLVGLAFVLLQPVPLLVWKGGTRKLDDLLPNFSCAADGRARLDEAAAVVSSKPPYRGGVGRAGSTIPPQWPTNMV